MMKNIILSITLSTLMLSNQGIYCYDKNQLIKNRSVDNYRETMFDYSAKALRLAAKIISQLKNIENQITRKKYTEKDFQQQITQKIKMLLQKSPNAMTVAEAASEFVLKVQSGEMGIATAIEKTIISLEQYEDFSITKMFFNILDIIMPIKEQGLFDELWSKYLELFSKNKNYIVDLFNPCYQNKEENIELFKIYIVTLLSNINSITQKNHWSSEETELLNETANLFAKYEKLDNTKINIPLKKESEIVILNIVTKIFQLILKEIKKELNIEHFENQAEIDKQLLLLANKITRNIANITLNQALPNKIKTTKKEYLLMFKKEISRKIKDLETT